MSEDARRTVDAVWRIESARIVATLARVTGDVGLAEDLAQDALVEALEQWPRTGVPRNAGAWLTAVAKRRAVDAWRRARRLHDREHVMAQEAAAAQTPRELDPEAWEPIDDDVLRLVFTACHPVLSTPSQIALTLRVVSGLSTEQIARMMLVSVPTIQARITRAKKALAAAAVPFATPEPAEWAPRLAGVLQVVYLVFTEGYAATSGDRWVHEELAHEALRLGRVLAALVPREPEAHALVALMELQASRFGARTAPDGTPILLEAQDRAKWDRAQIRRGRQALLRADRLRSGRGPYALQAAIAECHAVALTPATTDWVRIVALYEHLSAVAPSPIVDLNRAVAVSMAEGPRPALVIVDEIAAAGALAGSYLLPSVRGELLSRLGCLDEARTHLQAAAALTANARQREVLLGKVAALGDSARG